MADIQMCLGENCPLKRNCKRFTETPSEHQYYSSEPPYNFKTKICEMFLNKHTDDTTKIKDFKSI